MSYLTSLHHAAPLRSPALPMQSLAHGERRQPQPPRSQPAIDQLASLPLLRVLDADQLQRVAQRAVVRHLPRNGVVFEQGSRESGLYILLKGQAQLVRQNQRGRALVIDPLRAGDHFGELSAIDGAPQSSSARCATACEVLVLPRTEFLHLLHDAPALLQCLLRGLVTRVRRKQRRIALLALHDVRGCVVQQLHELADVQDGEHVVQGRICRQAIADMIGASRAMVSRVMMALTRSGELQLLPDGSTLLRCTAGQPPGDRPQRTRRRAGRTAPHAAHALPAAPAGPVAHADA